MTTYLDTLRQNAPPLSPEQFLAYHPGCWIQYYDDTPAKDSGKALSTSIFSPAFAARKQQDHCAVCFSLQTFQGSRTKESITSFRNLGVDVDLIPPAERGALDTAAIDRRKDDYLRDCLRPFPLQPHWLIETRHGFHILFRIHPQNDAAGIRLGEAVNRALVRALRGDDCASLLTQVLRVPGYQQFKDPEHPFLCRLLFDNAKTVEPYDLEKVRSVLAAQDGFPGEAKKSAATTVTPLPETAAPKRWQVGLAGVAEGQRNDTAASLAGKLLAQLPEALWETAGFGGLKEWNQKNPVPLAERELRAVFDSIARRERTVHGPTARTDTATAARHRDGPAPADKLVALVRSEGAVLFHDQFGEPHAHVRIDQAWHTCKIRSQEFRQWLAQRLWDTERKACGSEALHAAVNALAGTARFDGKQIELENRVAWHEGGSLWYDLSDRQGQAVRVTADGWEIVAEPPILFRHFSHQQPQVLPLRGRPLTALLPLLNLADCRHGPLLLVYLVTCLLPDIPHPLAVFFGPQGAAKTTTTRLLRRLIDPTALEGLSLPDPRQLPQLLFHHWFAAFDNVSAVSDEVSDLLCRAVTGDGFSRRRLYSDDEDLIYQFRRCLCLNGIGLVAERPDLLDRCLLFPLEHIPPEHRREEREVVRAFDDLRPELLGALFDALAGALRRYPSLPAVPLPRMADFARWGGAVAEAIGVGQDVFLTLYAENIRAQQEAAIEASPVASAVAEFMERRTEWSGTPTELLLQLQKLGRTDNRNEGWTGLPRRPNLLSKHLNMVKANLAQVGIRVDTQVRLNHRRQIVLRKTTVAAAPSSTPVARPNTGSDKHAPASAARGNGRDDGDDGSQTSPAAKKSSRQSLSPSPLPHADR